MNTTFALSMALSAIGVTGQIVTSRNPIIGWTISILAQPLWYAFYLTVGAWPLLLLATGYFAAAVLNLRVALRKRGITLLAYPTYAFLTVRDRLRRHQPDPEPATTPAA